MIILFQFHSPVPVAQGKVHVCKPVMLGKQGAFLLHHSFHTSHFQVATDSFMGEGLIGDGLKGVGNLGGIISLPRVDKMGGMVNVSWGKFQWTTTS